MRALVQRVSKGMVRVEGETIGAIVAALVILLGAGAAVAGQLGDLAESLLKRTAGVKDMGTLFPGHGGVLDRLDSLYFVVPVTAAMYRLFGVI